ncbi:1-phosphatidylinositol 4,5-bisphosphate phosphodiesterase zeta-1, partial [Rhinophrynus dorsalis]
LIIHSENLEKEINFDQTLGFLHKMMVPVDRFYAQHVFKAFDSKKVGTIDVEGLRSVYRSLVYRREQVDLYERISGGRDLLPVGKLLDFIQTEQCDCAHNEAFALELISQYEIIREAREAQSMTFEGFVRLMNSADNCVFRREKRQVYQDMTSPLSDYFISTSHNTYLVSDQLVGRSDAQSYERALMMGCRCLEIDCWDGPDDEPVVYHGHTLTSKLTFRSAISVIERFAFTASHYPLVLSLENHCSPRQQEIMAYHLVTILGDKLLTTTIANSSSEALPSPQQLKFKILIKNKKVDSPQDTVLEQGSTQQDLEGESVEQAAAQNVDDDDEEEEETRLRKSIKNLVKRMIPFKKVEKSKVKKKEKKIVLAVELSNLVVYTKSQTFLSFEHSRAHQKFYENNSITEIQAQKLARQSAQEFISHNTKFLTRIYPKGSRASSSNYSPQEFWNVGCHMVALNFQTPGIPMDLNNGKFLDNGGCGYILKPEFLRRSSLNFNPYSINRSVRPVTMTIKIISGFLLPPSNFSMGNTADPVVSVEIFGVPDDQCKQQTQVRKNNAFNPQWNESLSFIIRVPELALVRFCVEDQISLISNVFLGQFTLPFTCINK